MTLTQTVAAALLVAAALVPPRISWPRARPEARAMIGSASRQKVALWVPRQAPHSAFVGSNDLSLAY